MASRCVTALIIFVHLLTFLSSIIRHVVDCEEFLLSLSATGADEATVSSKRGMANPQAPLMLIGPALCKDLIALLGVPTSGTLLRAFLTLGLKTPTIMNRSVEVLKLFCHSAFRATFHLAFVRYCLAAFAV